MKALSLFSGIGGIDLACEWAGIDTVAFCEREPFCQKVLRKHWPNVPIYDDVCTLTKERLDADGIGAIELIHGGYPCQPFSHAGKREGANDDRHLWPEVKRLLEEIRPRWFVGENVAGHVTLGLDDVLSDLDDIGYTAQPVIIPACAVNAPHRRDRVFIVAHTPFYGCNTWRSESEGQQRELRIIGGSTQTTLIPDTAGERCGEAWEHQPSRSEERIAGCCETVSDTSSAGLSIRGRSEWSESSTQTRTGMESEFERSSKTFSYSNSERLQGSQEAGNISCSGSERNQQFTGCYSGREQWAIEPSVGRVANGIPNRVDRLKALGNAVVPQQIYPILAAIKQIDDMMH